MSKQYATKQFVPGIETNYLAPHLIPKVQSKVVPQVYSRIQPKLNTGFIKKEPCESAYFSLEQEADTMGKRASEGQEAKVTLSTRFSIQKKEATLLIRDNGLSEHAQGNFDPVGNSYTVPETSVYKNPQKSFDTLYSISVRFGVSVDLLKKVNNLQSDVLTAGQVLIIPSPPEDTSKEFSRTLEKRTVREEAPVINSIADQSAKAEPKNTVSDLLNRHTHYFMLDESGLAKELISGHLFKHPDVVSSILETIPFYNTDDLSAAILTLLPYNQWKNVDKTLLLKFYNALQTGYVSRKEAGLIGNLEAFLNPDKEISPVLKEQTVPNESTTPKKETLHLTAHEAVEKEPYASQMDNTYSKEKMYGDKGPAKLVRNFNQCNVTSLAMALRKLQPHVTLKNNTINLLISGGGYTEDQRKELVSKDLEDLILLRFEQVGVDYFLPLFESGTTKLYHHPHQFISCLNKVGLEILSTKKSNSSIFFEIYTQKAYQEHIVPMLQKDSKAILSSYLTSGGHIVSLEEIKSDGIVINDPYGVLGSSQGDYVINGQRLNAKYKKIINESQTVLTKKLIYNPQILTLLNSIKDNEDNNYFLPQNLGEKNFYSWKQIETYKIGKWIGILS